MRIEREGFHATLTSELFVAIYGTLLRHPWTEGLIHEDPYSLFNKYAEVLNWSDAATRADGDARSGHRSSALWQMNEAGGNWTDSAARIADHILWVQTNLIAATAQNELPIAQLILCAEKALQRIGTASIEAVQVMTPLDEVVVRQPHNWGAIALSDPSVRTEVQIELDGGVADAPSRYADSIIGELNSACEVDGIEFSEPARMQSRSVLLREPAEMNREFWIGEGAERVTTRTTVSEFSLDLSSYLIRHIARSCRIVGVSTPVIITLRRSDR